MLGAVSDHYGRRIVLIPAIFLFSGLSWMSGFAHSFTHLLVIRALMGLAEGSCWSTINAILEESSHPSRRGRNVGFVVSAAALVGLAVAPVLTTQVAARYGWRYAFFVAAIPGFVSGALVWAWVKEPARQADSEDVNRPSSLGNYASILRSRNVGLCCLAATGFMCWLYVQNVFCPVLHHRGAAPGCNHGRISSGCDRSRKLRFRIHPALGLGSYWPQARFAHHGGAIHGCSDDLAGSIPLSTSLATGSHPVPDERRRSDGRPGHCLAANRERSGRLGSNRHWVGYNDGRTHWGYPDAVGWRRTGRSLWPGDATLAGSGRRWFGISCSTRDERARSPRVGHELSC